MLACGDGEVSRGEGDDGNLDVGDGCSQCAEVVSSARKRCCARKFDGSVWCWGLNDQGNRAAKEVYRRWQVTGLTDVRHARRVSS